MSIEIYRWCVMASGAFLTIQMRFNCLESYLFLNTVWLMSYIPDLSWSYCRIPVFIKIIKAGNCVAVRLWLLKYDHETDVMTFFSLLWHKISNWCSKHLIQAAWSLTQIIPGITVWHFPIKCLLICPLTAVASQGINRPLTTVGTVSMHERGQHFIITRYDGMDELTRQMDFSGGLSEEKGEIFEFFYEVLKLPKDKVTIKNTS